MVCDLNRGLAAHTQPAAADRILGVAFELAREPHAHDAALAVPHDLRVALDDANGQAAAGAAQRTDARLPFGDSRNEILVGDESDQLVFRTAA